MQPEEETDEVVLNEAQKVADKWLPAECVVMDLVLVDNGLKLIEFNCINGSGFYKNNVRKFVRALTDYVDII